jgi:hypothetical protein
VRVWRRGELGGAYTSGEGGFAASRGLLAAAMKQMMGN